MSQAPCISYQKPHHTCISFEHEIDFPEYHKTGWEGVTSTQPLPILGGDGPNKTTDTMETVLQ